MSELTPAEKEYFESGGQKTDGLIAETTPQTPEPAAAAVETPAPPPAPEPVVAADPTEPGEEEIAAPDGKSKRRVVDSRALKEERRKRQEIENELRQERELRARVDERLNMLSAAIQQPDPTPQTPEQPEAEIDPEQDIFGAYRQQQKRMADLQKAFEALQNGQQEMRQQTEEERQTGAMIASYRQDAAAFAQQNADFTDAYNFLLSKCGEQLKAMGYSDPEVRSALYNEEMSLAQRALGMKQSPSAHIYALAQSMGYAKKAPQATQAAPQATPPAQPVPVPSVTAEIDRIKAGQSSSKSLSSGGGAAGEELSLELLANMDMKEFAAFMEKPGNREKVEQALGRRAA